jgi:tetratricopeptide (TPR) repeat protein
MLQSIICSMRALAFAAVLASAVVLAHGIASAGQDNPRLDKLFDTLKSTDSDEEAQRTEAEIWRVWIAHKNPEIEKLMRRGMAAFNEDDQEGALEAFNGVVQSDKSFAEGWNKRATVEYAMGDFEASIADIERTLALEPRHFGALSGLGQIYLAMEKKALALKAFEAALKIDPHLSGVRENVEELRKELQGSPI